MPGLCHESSWGAKSQLENNKQLILAGFVRACAFAVAAAASRLQYCSVGSLMADGRQCCFPPGEEEVVLEEGGGLGSPVGKTPGL